MSHLPIRVNTLRGDQKIDFDVYIKIDDRMLLYLRRGDSFEGQRLIRLKSKKLKKMFILEEEEGLYRSYVQRNIDISYDDKGGKSLGTRVEIIHGQQQAAAEAVFEHPESAEHYQIAKDGTSKYVNFLLANEQAIPAFFQIENTDKSLSHHGVNVSTLAIGLAKKLKMEDARTIQMMSLGALLHDVGHHDSGLAFHRPIDSFSPQEIAEYQTHPEQGGLRIQDKKHFDQLVLNIIAQHEECIDGSGYPKKLKESEMDPTVVIVSSCNAFDRYISFDGLNRFDASKKMMIDRVGRHPLTHIQLLADLAKS